MANAIHITIDNSQLVQWRNQVAMSDKAIDDLSNRAVRRAGQVLYDRARASAPVDTGDLLDSIYLKTERGAIEVGSPLERGFFQEFGTSRHAPQPWLFGNGEKAAEALEVMLADAAVSALMDAGLGLVGGLGSIALIVGAVFATAPEDD